MSLMTTVRLSTTALAAILLGIAVFGAAHADQNLNCGAYATKAVEQQNQNKDWGCGLTGVGWSADFQAHFNWCRLDQVKMGHLVEEDRVRAEALKKCAAKDEKAVVIPGLKIEPKVSPEMDTACGLYAMKAREQNQEGLKNKCGFSGGHWSDVVSGHRAWCLEAGKKEADKATAIRADLLKKCQTAKTFESPMVYLRNGITGIRPVDICLKNTEETRSAPLVYCDKKKTAARFCELKGFKQVSTYSTDLKYSKPRGADTTGPGIISAFLEDKGYCGGRWCYYFVSITCKFPNPSAKCYKCKSLGSCGWCP